VSTLWNIVVSTPSPLDEAVLSRRRVDVDGGA
jgi:hypothetical protein